MAPSSSRWLTDTASKEWCPTNNLGLFFARNALRANAHGPDADRIRRLIDRRQEGYYLEHRLGTVPYLAGSDFSCADIMVMFNLTSLPLFGGRKVDDLPNTMAYVERLSARPAYKKAMAIAGPGAQPPAS